MRDRLLGQRESAAVAALLVLLLFGAGCSRYEWVSLRDLSGGGCPGPRWIAPPPARLGAADALPVAVRGARTLRGWVRDAESGAPMGGAEVGVSARRPGDLERAAAPPAAAAVTDSAGVFVLESALPPGSYELTARSTGYFQRRMMVELPLASNDAVAVSLWPAALDGPCSGTIRVRVRKPWWKWW